MLLTIKVKLNPTEEQKQKLLRLMEIFNIACNDISKIAYESKTYNKIELQHNLYYRIREQYKLPAQISIRAISKVVDSYKSAKTLLKNRNIDHKKQCEELETLSLIYFKPHGTIIYDERIMGFKGLEKVSLITLVGREVIPMLIGGYGKLDQRRIKGQADLIYTKNIFYLCLVIEQPEEPTLTPEGYLGVDLGIIKLATTSDNIFYSGEKVESVRSHYSGLKAELQHVGTESAKRHLRKLSGKEARFKRNTNHIIGKNLVAVAKDTKRGIALEDLKGIRTRTTVRKEQRDKHSKWAFYQLQTYIEYKSKISGVPIVFVNPKNTSRRCPECKHTDKLNRVSQSEFKCLSCGYAENADYVSARNIKWKAEVNQPIVVCPDGNLNYKPMTNVISG